MNTLSLTLARSNFTAFPEAVTRLAALALFSPAAALPITAVPSTWGNNGNGALGNGSVVASTVTGDTAGVLSGKTVTRIAAGSDFCLALTSDGKVFSPGRQRQYQLGNNLNNAIAPDAVDMTGVRSGVTVTEIAAGYQHVSASKGKLYAWGANGRLRRLRHQKRRHAHRLSRRSRHHDSANQRDRHRRLQRNAHHRRLRLSLTYPNKAGVAISSANSTRYTIARTALADVGSSTATATNLAGSVASSAAMLAVNGTPALLSQSVAFNSIPHHVDGDAPLAGSAACHSFIRLSAAPPRAPAAP